MPSLPAGRGTEGRAGRGLGGAARRPDRPEEEGCPGWKADCPASSRTSAHPDLAAVPSGASPSVSAFSAWGSSEQGGDRWGQVGSGPSRCSSRPQLRWPPPPRAADTPHTGPDRGRPRTETATFGRSQVLCPLNRPGLPATLRDRETASQVNAGRTRAERGRGSGQSPPAGHGGSARAFHGPRGPRPQPEDEDCGGPLAGVRGSDGLPGDRDGPQGWSSPSARAPAGMVLQAPHAEPRVVGVGPTGLPRGVTPGGAPGQAAGRQRKALKRRVADVGVHQGGPWGQGRRPSRRARLSRGRARGPVGQVPVGLLVPQS